MSKKNKHKNRDYDSFEANLAAFGAFDGTDFIDPSILTNRECDTDNVTDNDLIDDFERALSVDRSEDVIFEKEFENELNTLVENNDDVDTDDIEDEVKETIFEIKDLVEDQTSTIRKQNETIESLKGLVDTSKAKINELNLTIEHLKDENEKLADLKEDKKIVDPRIVRVREHIDAFRITIDDGISAFTINTSAADKQNLEENIISVYDSDDVGDKVATMIKYIISMRMPYAIFDAEEFYNNDDLKIVNNYDSFKYMFFKTDDFVFAYIVDEESFRNLDKAFTGYKYDIEDTLKYYITMSYESATKHIGFNAEDEFNVKVIYDSEVNLKDKFIELFINDDDTEVLVDPNEDVAINVMDVDTLHRVTRGFISVMTGEPVFDPFEAYSEDEDDEDDDESDEDLEEEVTSDDDTESEEESTEIETEEDSSDDADVLAEGMEMVEYDAESTEEAESTPEKSDSDITVIKGDSKKSAVVKVIR